MDKDFYKTYFEIEKSHWWFRVRRNLILDLLRQYKIPKTARIYDFGCGSGFTVGYLQKLGYDVSGADISAEAIEFGIDRGVRNLEVVQDHKIKSPEGGFDVILALDVIEHIKDHHGVIHDVEVALKQGGLAIITVPAYQWLWGVQDEVSHHHRRYTSESLARLVRENTNLKIIKETYFNTFLFIPIAIVRVFSKWFNLKQRESDFDINNKWLGGIFFFIFNLESKILRFIKMPFGTSILLVSKKESK